MLLAYYTSDFAMSKQKRINRILNSLDLGFSDFYTDENVRQLTLENKLGKIEKAETTSSL